MIKWFTKDDTFQFGQWFFGSFGEHKADLSPNGELLIYFAGKPRAGDFDRWYWTAISRPPYFTALALWFHGDTWGGGGTFISNHVLAEGPTGAPDEGKLPSRLKFDKTRRGEHYRALQASLNGWQKVSHAERPKDWPQGVGVFSYRPQPRGSARIWSIQEKVGRALKWRSVVTDGEKWPPLLVLDDQNPNWDQRGRLISIQGGCLYGREPNNLSAQRKLIADLNATPTETFPAPAWATEWPEL